MNKSSSRLLGLVPESFKIVMAFIVFSIIEERDSFVKAAIIIGIIIIFHSSVSI
jgi:multisubunit Na+/H+ antiporter MnhF subunit